MLKKPFRLTKEKDFKAVYLKGKSFFSNELSIKFSRNNLIYSRFGIVVSHRVASKATKRNRIKRQLREIIRNNLMKIKRGLDVVIITKKPILTIKFNEKRELLEQVLKKMNIIDHD